MPLILDLKFKLHTTGLQQTERTCTRGFSLFGFSFSNVKNGSESGSTTTKALFGVDLRLAPRH